MRHFKLFFLVLALVSGACSAQYNTIGFRLGFGGYAMLKLNDFQSFRTSLTGLPLKTTESYPMTPVYRFEFVRNSKHFISKWGVFYVFNSTGARSTLSDYSGRIDLDAIINGHQIGITFEHTILAQEKLDFGAYTDWSVIETNLKLKDYISFVYPTSFTSTEKSDFRAYGFCAEPGVYVQYHILKHIRVRMNLGLLIDYSGDLHTPYHKNMKLFYDNSTTKPQWAGLRMGFQVDI